jgi:predicted RNA-binding protein with PUA-like domain
MAVGDVAFFYHSNVSPPGIVGIMQVVEAQLVDPSQFDLESPYFDPKATIAAPRWHTVKVEYIKTLDRQIELSRLRERFTADELIVVRRGNRLSILPVGDAIAQQILEM